MTLTIATTTRLPMPYEVFCPSCGRTTRYEFAHAEIILCCKCGKPILLDGKEIPEVEPASRQTLT